MSSTLKFLLATDSQLGMADNFISRIDRREFAYKWIKNSDNENNIGLDKELENLRKMVSIANNLKPDFFIITGDMIDDIQDDNIIKKFCLELNKLNNEIDLFLVPGNHDVGENPLVPSSSAIKKYKTLFGNDYYSFEKKGVLFIVINSSLYMNPSVLESRFLQQNEFLKDLLKSYDSNIPIIFFTHHPPYLGEVINIDFDSDSQKESEGYWEFPKITREILFEIIEEKNVLAFLTGHLHQNKNVKFNNVDIIVTSSLGLPLGTDPSGYRSVEISEQILNHSFHTL